MLVHPIRRRLDAAMARELRELREEFEEQVTRMSRAEIDAIYTPEKIADLLTKAEANRVDPGYLYGLAGPLMPRGVEYKELRF